MPQVEETLFPKRICKNVCNLFSGINLFHDNCSLTKKTLKVMILDGNMLFPWSKLWDLRNSDIAFNIFPYSATKYWMSCILLHCMGR